jgi:hypothetical protein
MPPITIEVILKCFYYGKPTEEQLNPVGLQQAWTANLIQKDIETGFYGLTDRGEAYVNKLMSIQPPTKVITWEFPDES